MLSKITTRRQYLRGLIIGLAIKVHYRNRRDHTQTEYIEDVAVMKAYEHLWGMNQIWGENLASKILDQWKHRQYIYFRE